jgi:hypothetical protein
VAGYNIYRASNAAGPFSKINTQLITDTVFIDTEGTVGITAGSSGTSGSYYGVTAVDDAGFESSQSLAVSPASTGSSAAQAIEAVACFIGTVTNQKPANVWWLVVILIVALTILKGVRCQRSGVSRCKSDT